MQKLKAIWKAHSIRERFLVLFGLASMLAWAFFVYLYIPISDGYSEKKRAFEQGLQDYAWLKQQSHQIELARSQVVIPRDEVIVLVHSSLDGASFSRALVDEVTTEEGRNHIEVAIASGEGQEVFAWVDKLIEQGLILLELQVKTRENGKVRARAVFLAD